MSHWKNIIPGAEASGHITALGEGVEGFEIGQVVTAISPALTRRLCRVYGHLAGIGDTVIDLMRQLLKRRHSEVWALLLIIYYSRPTNSNRTTSCWFIP